jgi:hypothetical protein
MSALQQLISASARLFSGAARTDEAVLRQLETSLGVLVQLDVRLFWLSYGSGLSGAAPSARSSITDTLRFRSAAFLPNQYVVLDDRGDAGAVLLDTVTPDGAVLWVDSHAIGKVASGELLPAEHDYFPTFAAWVSFCIEQASDEA